ncbi:DUF3025 domain-containing protein [Pseudoalteromonas sp. MMG010]|uniref:DUF3025 domain-containing protein n=1 Tax=Pseudoalteromonas sp. MMG010 TaxID=2822685 RepID=UPI001B3A1401|nr:DUF3025 domain-containing protein [Pseudoalteromonas sp. MMG010]MBQ4832449.1 DUF3025 domain-containing protein [Pseudoalteromonas sp. MMG010]
MKRFTPLENFQTECLKIGAFSHLQRLFSIDKLTNWPSNQWFSQYLNAVNENNIPIEFVDDAEIDYKQRYYEQVIYETGQVPTRKENWHDLFGGFIWCLFPKTKALINSRHVDEIELAGNLNRTKHRNALTLFDECAVILAVSESHWSTLLKEHQWQKAFVELRANWGESINAFMFGHANYEMLTKPYIGLTGKAFFVPVNDDFFTKKLIQQYAIIDDALYQMIKNEGSLSDNKSLSPLPLLGIPGWYDDNKDPTFYNNTDYFRPKPRKQK